MNTQWQTQVKANSTLMRSFASTQSGLLQRKCACGQHTVAGSECAECQKKRLQRTIAGSGEPETVPPIVHEVLRSSGQPLDPATRAFMEPRFGQDFSGVRVHTDVKAAESARAVNALAYTVGRDVVFGGGQFAPETGAGKRLLAHELTHLVQQGDQRTVSNGPLHVETISSNAEQEAMTVSKTLTGEGSYKIDVSATNPGMLMRQIDPDIDEMVEQGIVEETESTSRPTRRSRPATPAVRGQGEAARQMFDGVRDDYAQRLGVPSGGQVHHAIELQALDRYPGAFAAQELNDFDNMRGIGTELEGRRQLHNSKIREFWDRHYRMLDAEIARRNLQPGTETYNSYVRRYLTMARDEIDYLLEQFFTEYRTGRRGSRVSGGGGAGGGPGRTEPRPPSTPSAQVAHPEELQRIQHQAGQIAQNAERQAVETIEQRLLTRSGGVETAQIATRSFLSERFPRIIATSLTRIATSRAARRTASLIPVLGWAFAGVDAYNGLRDILRGNIGRGLAGISCAGADVASDVLHIGDAVSGVGGTVLSLAVQAGTTACQVAIEMSRMRDRMNELQAEIERLNGLPSDGRLREYYELDDEAIQQLRASFNTTLHSSTTQPTRLQHRGLLDQIEAIERSSRALVWSEQGLLELNRERDRLASEL